MVNGSSQSRSGLRTRATHYVRFGKYERTPVEPATPEHLKFPMEQFFKLSNLYRGYTPEGLPSLDHIWVERYLKEYQKFTAPDQVLFNMEVIMEADRVFLTAVSKQHNS